MSSSSTARGCGAAALRYRSGVSGAVLENRGFNGSHALFGKLLAWYKQIHKCGS